MRHEIKFDRETLIMTLRVEEAMTMEETIEAEKIMNDLTKDVDSYNLMIDMRKASAKVDKEIRKRLQEQMGDQTLTKIAVTVTNPAVRMVGKVIIAAMGKTKDTKFFKTEAEALAWLKGEEK